MQKYYQIAAAYEQAIQTRWMASFTRTGLKLVSRGEFPESIGVKFLIPKTDPDGGVFEWSADDEGGISGGRFKGRTIGWPGGELRPPGGEFFGDGMPPRTFGPEPFCLGMILTTPVRLPGGPTGRCWIIPGLGEPMKVNLGGDGTPRLSGLIRIRGGGREWMYPSWTGLSPDTPRSPRTLRNGRGWSPGDLMASLLWWSLTLKFKSGYCYCKRSEISYQHGQNNKEVKIEACKFYLTLLLVIDVIFHQIDAFQTYRLTNLDGVQHFELQTITAVGKIRMTFGKVLAFNKSSLKFTLYIASAHYHYTRD